MKLILRPYVDAPVAQPLQDATFDLVIRLTDSVREKALGSQKLGTERILLVAAPEHPLLARKTVRPRDLAGQLLLMTEEGCAYRREFERALSARGVQPHAVADFASVEAIKQCATLGMGIALLPEIVVAADLARKTLVVVPWRAPDLSMPTHVVWHKDRTMTPAMRGFLGVVGQVLGSSGTFSSESRADSSPRTPRN